MTSSFYRPPIKDITITSSIGRKSSSLYYGQTTPQPPSDFESFPIEAISSSTAGVFPDLHGSISSSNYYINITQSWSSSILGPLGYGVFVNNDQKEFYNGELSGSNLTISDQRLIDEDCVQFLEVDTIGSSYTSKFFYGNSYLGYPPYVFYEELYSIMTINEFMNENVAPHSGEIFLYYSQDTYRNVVEQTPIVDPSGKVVMGEGILFVKINRVDNDGSDNTLSLQSLQQIRIKFQDVYGTLVPLAPTSPFKYDYTRYDVLSISEYPNYYLYLVNSKNRMSITSNKIGDYSTYASGGAANINQPIFTPPSTLIIGNYTYLSGSASSSFTASSGIYTFADTPNIGFTITASATASAANVTMSLVYAYNLDTSTDPPGLLSGQVIASVASTGSNQILTLSAPLGNRLSPTSSYPIEGSRIALTMFHTYTTGNNGLSGARLNIAQLVAPSSSATSVTVFDPTLTTAFTNTDCDVTMNNAIEDRVSSIYQQIDYSTSTTVPVNYQAVVSRSATYAQVNDFNYYSTPRALAKYQGAKLETAILNFYSSSDIGPDKTPNVQLLENYFLYFDWIGGTTPDFIGKSAAHVRALIDIDGNIYEPSDVGIYFDSYIRTFIKGADVNVVIRAADNSYPSNGLRSILYPYNFPVPVIASQTGSIPTASVALTSIAFFKYPDYYDSVITYFNSNSIPNFKSLWTGSSGASSYNSSPTSIAVPSTYTQLPINGNVYVSNTTTTGSNNIRFTNTSKYTRVKLTSTLNNILLFNYSEAYEGNPGGPIQQQVQNSTVVTFNVQIKEFPTGSTYGASDATVIAQANFEVRGNNQYAFGPSSGNASGVKVYKPYTFSLSTDWINIDLSKAYSVVFKIIQIEGAGIKYIEGTTNPVTTGASINLAIASQILKEMGVYIPNPQLRVEQENGPTSTGYTTASYNPGSSLYYWTTGSDKNILYGPQFTENIYKQTDVGALFQAWTPSGSEKNAGYGDYIPFQIYPGDQIRFEGDESQVYNVVESYPPGEIATGTPTPTSSFYNPYLQLKLDRPIIDGTEVNSFLVRRLEVNPSFMVLDWDGTGYTGGGGFIIPQYMAKRGSGMDYNKIITSLKEKGIIPS